MASKPSARRYVPELGQLSFGNRWSEFQIPLELRDVVNGLLTDLVLRAGGDQLTAAYGIELKNGVFEMHPYYWGEDKREAEKPNFKCGDLEIRWYKFIGRGMSANKLVTEAGFRAVIEKCMRALKDSKPSA